MQEKSRADVTLLEKSVIRLNQNTTITLENVKEERTSVIDMIKGAAHFFSSGPDSLEVHTPYTTAGVRGTEFLVSIEDDKTLLSTFEGTVVASNDAGSLTLTGGQSAIAEAGKPPVLSIVARPRDAVQWTLYYPPVLYLSPDEFQSGPGWEGMVRKSIELYISGDIQGAFDSIKDVPEDVRDPRFFTYRASLLLAVGQVNEADADIERALRLDPKYSDAFALETIIYIVENEKDKALDAAEKAVETNPDSATAEIALSYAQQAMFDLKGARTSLEKAVQLDPQNALAWARLAEIWASFGDLGKALNAAQEAVVLEPNLSRTQTVLGFAYLTQVDTKQAKDAFEKAIALDQADYLPRLGLGLAKIRDGDLHGGGREIEIAASLDPNNSIVRSYLGKTYFEEKRTKLDVREYETAKQLDPLDPTPWFYDAIAKQTTNRPVEALQNMQKSIELNNNRAVYRSRLLLDSDLAARSAGLARIYTDLSFQQLALVEGWKSVNIDPSSFSAHRFLADSYAVLPRHEIARVSELLQSQLLQPINITPIQPRLAESNLFLISSQGPGSVSFDEFNPLFNRNQVTLLTSGLVAENETWAGEGVVSAIYNKASFSGGYSYFGTDGFRENDDQKDQIATAYLQLELTYKTSIQAEYRYRNTELGDLALRFFPDDFLPGLRNKQERNYFRVGGRHAFSPGSVLIGNFTYQNADFNLTDKLSSFDAKRPEDAYSAEAQHLFRSQYINLVSGAGYFDVNGRIDTTITIDIPPPDGPIIAQSTTSTDLQHLNMYIYSYLNPMNNVTFTLGASADFLSGDSPDVGDKDKFNPKFGITWNPIPSTTLRAAAFRVLKRTLITDQTLEPTQVAGFNQFFDDVNGTESWVFGGAIDQKFPKDFFGGVQFTKRDLEVPFLDFTADPENPPVRNEDVDEYLGLAYLFWAPHPWLALRAQYLFERFETQGLTDQPKELTTNRVPLGVNFFHPSGLGSNVTVTYLNQDGDFLSPDGDGFVSGEDNFWIVDAAVYYRLPKRYGFITVGATNLFDQEFNYFEVDVDNPRIQPGRVFYARVTLALP
ncbi:MAG: FecR domain-containing protein [Thermodesulfobacteriota bacterium]